MYIPNLHADLWNPFKLREKRDVPRRWAFCTLARVFLTLKLQATHLLHAATPNPKGSSKEGKRKTKD